MASAGEIIHRLQLQPHPEGGAYREIHRSTEIVHPADGRGPRAAFTLIWFLLRAGESSAWHRVLSEETWHWCDGSPLELLVRDPEFANERSIVIGSHSNQKHPSAIVPARHWQAARSLGDWTLVQCGVAPGFDFADFTMKDPLANGGAPDPGCPEGG
jgi:predicted cupin superfamily sugar epimerase